MRLRCHCPSEEATQGIMFAQYDACCKMLTMSSPQVQRVISAGAPSSAIEGMCIAVVEDLVFRSLQKLKRRVGAKGLDMFDASGKANLTLLIEFTAAFINASRAELTDFIPIALHSDIALIHCIVACCEDDVDVERTSSVVKGFNEERILASDADSSPIQVHLASHESGQLIVWRAREFLKGQEKQLRRAKVLTQARLLTKRIRACISKGEPASWSNLPDDVKEWQAVAKDIGTDLACLASNRDGVAQDVASVLVRKLREFQDAGIEWLTLESHAEEATPPNPCDVQDLMDHVQQLLAKEQDETMRAAAHFYDRACFVVINACRELRPAFNSPAVPFTRCKTESVVDKEAEGGDSAEALEFEHALETALKEAETPIGEVKVLTIDDAQLTKLFQNMPVAEVEAWEKLLTTGTHIPGIAPFEKMIDMAKATTNFYGPWTESIPPDMHRAINFLFGFKYVSLFEYGAKHEAPGML
jgi:hypothetical protein